MQFFGRLGKRAMLGSGQKARRAFKEGNRRSFFAIRKTLPVRDLF
jgi:hypothetical protein